VIVSANQGGSNPAGMLSGFTVLSAYGAVHGDASVRYQLLCLGLDVRRAT